MYNLFEADPLGLAAVRVEHVGHVIRSRMFGIEAGSRVGPADQPDGDQAGCDRDYPAVFAFGSSEHIEVRHQQQHCWSDK
jgi:hypothetical protein